MTGRRHLIPEDPHGAVGPEPMRADVHREQRKGVPEVILAQDKDLAHVIKLINTFLQETGRALVSRVSPLLAQEVESRFGQVASVEYNALAKFLIVRRPDRPRPVTGGRVGIIAAGTADVPAAEEARLVAEEMGCEVFTAYDVGVAGIHRLFGPLSQMEHELEVDCIIVAAGMDGALPSVVAGLASAPVIGLPTPVGYGMGGRGEAALLSMLQTCAPGLAVVNIDNGVGAGAMAALIANRVARARQKSEERNV
jgi:NCAIR mutase (PurE)-related protein